MNIENRENTESSAVPREFPRAYRRDKDNRILYRNLYRNLYRDFMGIFNIINFRRCSICSDVFSFILNVFCLVVRFEP